MTNMRNQFSGLAPTAFLVCSISDRILCLLRMRIVCVLIPQSFVFGVFFGIVHDRGDVFDVLCGAAVGYSRTQRFIDHFLIEFLRCGQYIGIYFFQVLDLPLHCICNSFSAVIASQTGSRKVLMPTITSAKAMSGFPSVLRK